MGICWPLKLGTIGCVREIIRDLGPVSGPRERQQCWRIPSPEIRLSFLNLFGRSAPANPDDLATLGADFEATGLASEATQSNVYGSPRRRVDSP
jgi:hypothetical protein